MQAEHRGGFSRVEKAVELNRQMRTESVGELASSSII
jgi:hypothetical protein